MRRFMCLRYYAEAKVLRCSHLSKALYALEEMDNSMIETERLILSPVTPEDLDIYKKLLTCAETTRYLPGGKPFSL